MTDVCVTVPKGLWNEWIAEGDLPGDEWTWTDYHFWLYGPLPKMEPGERVYIVAHGKLRGYAPLAAIETRCRLRPNVGCLLRRDGAVAVTIPAPIRGFRGWLERWWDRAEEVPFPEWRTP